MSSRNSASSGPGRGTSRSRATTYPGQRAQRRSPKAVGTRREEEPKAKKDQPEKKPFAGGITWRLVVLVVVLLGVAVVVAQSLRIYFAQAAEIAAEREAISQLQEKISAQRDQLQRWQDPEFVRSQARVRLGWVMPGEVGYRVIGVDGKPVDGSEIVGNKEKKQLRGSWFDRMWGSVKVADDPAPQKSAAPTTPREEKIVTLEMQTPSGKQS